MAYCPKCGKKVDNNARFCRICGQMLEVNVNTTKKEIIKNEGSEFVALFIAFVALVISVIPVNLPIIYGGAVFSFLAICGAGALFAKKKSLLNWTGLVASMLSLMVNVGWIYYYLSLK